LFCNVTDYVNVVGVGVVSYVVVVVDDDIDDAAVGVCIAICNTVCVAICDVLCGVAYVYVCIICFDIDIGCCCFCVSDGDVPDVADVRYIISVVVIGVTVADCHVECVYDRDDVIVSYIVGVVVIMFTVSWVVVCVAIVIRVMYADIIKTSNVHPYRISYPTSLW